MAVDRRLLAADLRRFYDFADEVVVLVGAGGSLFDPERRPRRLIAVDKNEAPLLELEKTMAAKGMSEALRTTVGDFHDVTEQGDVVYFEFSLHEMPDPTKTLEHAKSLAPNIVVFDHSLGSEWMFLAAEDDQVRRCADALNRFGIRRKTALATEQRFADYDELASKLAGGGVAATSRIERFAGATNIAIAMPYELVLL
jgi:hypothetical protein